jgi:hypothetical protein
MAFAGRQIERLHALDHEQALQRQEHIHPFAQIARQ